MRLSTSISSGTRRLEAASPLRTSDFGDADLGPDASCIELDDVSSIADAVDV